MDNCIKILIADADEGFTSDLACYLKTNSSFDYRRLPSVFSTFCQFFTI